MRVLLLFCLGLGLMASAHAQNSVNMSMYKESPMVQRWDSSLEKAMAAVNAGSDPKQKKKRGKPDPALTVEFSDRTFSSGREGLGSKKAGIEAYNFGNAAPEVNKFQTREFFGLKNPWFGRKVYRADAASLLGRDTAAGATKTFQTDSASTREFYQANKTIPVQNEVVPLKSTKVEGKSQGMLDVISGQQQMTVEQVRELLNKNR